MPLICQVSQDTLASIHKCLPAFHYYTNVCVLTHRVGLMGNPSDGFNGKTIAMTIANFWAEVTLMESQTLVKQKKQTDIKHQGKLCSSFISLFLLRPFYLILWTTLRSSEACRISFRSAGKKGLSKVFVSDFFGVFFFAWTSTIWTL